MPLKAAIAWFQEFKNFRGWLKLSVPLRTGLYMSIVTVYNIKPGSEHL